MDREDAIITIILFVVALIIIAIVSIPTIIENNMNAMASQKADSHCRLRGYDTYDTFKRKVFSDEPLGVKCNHIMNKKEILTDGNMVVAVTPN